MAAKRIHPASLDPPSLDGPNFDPPGLDRRDRIREIVLREGQASVGRLAADLGVSAETVRRDMKLLEESGYIARIHGGAKAATGYALPHIDLRIGRDRAAKEHIAHLAAPLVEPGMSVFFSGGSTVLALAWRLREGPRIDATTVMVDVGLALASGGQTEVCLCGGLLNAVSRACTGYEASEMIARRSFDLAFLGASGLDPGRGLLGPSEGHLQSAQTVRRQARKVVAVMPHSALGNDDRLQILPLNALDILVTDRPPPRDLFRALEGAGVRVMF